MSMTASSIGSVSVDDEHACFMQVMPRLCALARRRFGRLPGCHRDEAIAETLAAGFVAYLSLKRRGRVDQVSTNGFVRNAVRAATGGRRVGSAQAGCDVLSDLGRRRHGRSIASLDGDTPADDTRLGWLHEAIADRRTGIPDQVAIRVDGGHWLSALPQRDRRMVEQLALGERASAVARRFGLSPARLSQLRRAWHEQWQTCVGIAA